MTLLDIRATPGWHGELPRNGARDWKGYARLPPLVERADVSALVEHIRLKGTLSLYDAGQSWDACSAEFGMGDVGPNQHYAGGYGEAPRLQQRDWETSQQQMRRAQWNAEEKAWEAAQP